MTESARWTCPTCNEIVLTPFCSRCGEQPLVPHDLTLRGLSEKLLHALTSIDARAARSALCLLRHPGELTLAWVRGARKPYVAPFQLFLIANVIFFALQWLTGVTVISSSLDSHLHHQDWRELALSLLTQRLQKTQLSLAQYAPVFDRAIVLNAKSLIGLMAIPFALFLPLVFVRQPRPFMTHAVFSLHFYTFLLLLFCVAMLAAKLSSLLGFGGIESLVVDNVLSTANFVACVAYLYIAIGPVYGTAGAMRGLQAVVLTVAIAAIVLGYRFVLFLITLYAT